MPDIHNAQLRFTLTLRKTPYVTDNIVPRTISNNAIRTELQYIFLIGIGV